LKEKEIDIKNQPQQQPMQPQQPLQLRQG
jgi:hypothetical protein